MHVIIYSFNLNISPKMSYGVLEHDSYVTELHAYGFVIKHFVIRKGHYLCWTLYIYKCISTCMGTKQQRDVVK